jgi:hypothetical protein
MGMQLLLFGDSSRPSVATELGPARRQGAPPGALFASYSGPGRFPSEGAVSCSELPKRPLALHYLALVRYRTDPETRVYVERRRAEGKSFREAMRCLERHLSSHVIYRRLVSDLEGGGAADLTR